MLGDSRRLTGRNLWLESPGAVLDATLGGHDPAMFAAAWGAALDHALAALGWQGAARASRAWPGGVTLAFAAPIDALYAATEVAEWAFAVARGALDPAAPAAPEFEAEMTRLRTLLAEERNPALLRLREEGIRRGLTCLADDTSVSLGLGTGSRSWPVRRLGS